MVLMGSSDHTEPDYAFEIYRGVARVPWGRWASGRKGWARLSPFSTSPIWDEALGAIQWGTDGDKPTWEGSSLVGLCQWNHAATEQEGRTIGAQCLLEGIRPGTRYLWLPTDPPESPKVRRWVLWIFLQGDPRSTVCKWEWLWQWEWGGSVRDVATWESSLRLPPPDPPTLHPPDPIPYYRRWLSGPMEWQIPVVKHSLAQIFRL